MEILQKKKSMNKKKIFVGKNISLIKAISLINKNSINGVFVINKKKQVIGILMDSDIRKYLLHKTNITNIKVKDIMKVNFYFLNNKNKIDKKKELIRSNKILIPILNQNKTLKDYIHIKDFFLDNKSKIDKKKVLVIGGFGYIGSILVETLINNDFEVNVLDKNLYGNYINKKVLKNKRLKIFIGDCFDRLKLRSSLIGVQDVIHLGEIVGDPAVNVNRKFSIKNNFVNTNLLLNECVKFNIRKFIFASSCSVYGDSMKLCRETSKTNPVSLYAECKLACEEQILSFSKIKRFEPIILRISTVHGLSNRLRFDLAANRFTLFALKNKLIKLFGEESWRPFIHVKDVSNIFFQFLISNKKNLHNQIYNLGFDDENYKIIDIIKILQRKLKFDVVKDKVFVDRRNYFVSFKKLHNKILIKKKYTLKKSIYEMMRFFKNKKIKITNDIYHNDKAIIKLLTKK